MADKENLPALGGENAPLLSPADKMLYAGESEPGEKGKAVVNYVQSVQSVQSTVPWRTGLFDCCAMADPRWHSTDCEICLMGWQAPCILFGSNQERLSPSPSPSTGSPFWPNCCLYLSVYLTGHILCKANVIAPCMTYPSRTALRRKYGLKGHAEMWKKSTGCCVGQSEEYSEKMETTCDCLVHFFCHPCALCQEARELRRRTPHPSQIEDLSVSSPVQVQAPKSQSMA